MAPSICCRLNPELLNPFVLMYPGLTPFTLIPLDVHSAAIVLINDCTAAFAAEYTEKLRIPIRNNRSIEYNCTSFRYQRKYLLNSKKCAFHQHTEQFVKMVFIN